MHANAERPHDKNHQAYIVPGLQRGLRLLEVLGSAQRSMSISEIASEMGLTRSSVFRLVYTLRHMGFLEQGEHTKLVTLGPRVLNIGYAFLATKDIIEVARPDLEALRDETEVSAHLAIRDGRDILYLFCAQTRSGFLSNMNVGSRVPAYAAPMGWLLLSDLSARELRSAYAGQRLLPFTEQTPTSIAELLARVDEARFRGYVVSRGIMEAGGSSVSAVVLDKNGLVAGAVDVSGPDSAFQPDVSNERYVEAVTNAARRISRRLGFATRA